AEPADSSRDAATQGGPHPAAAAEQAGGSQRRPLSTFAPPSPTVEARFHPALEVDALRWSAVAEALVGRHAERWSGALHALLAADDAGRSLIGVAGAAPGAGTTTVLGCLGRILVDAGKTVALVDGNFTAPGLARTLGLAADLGWEDVLAGRTPLADAVIHAIEDRLAILPLTQGGLPAAEKLDSIHASVTAGVLRYHYDVILFDLGNLAQPQQSAIASRLAARCRLDGLLVIETREARLGPSRLSNLAPSLASLCLGAIENQSLDR
ncbi:MAG TPA: cellulose synthase operon protein YhjQ/BcsQ, partial [Lacipirellulaceae bacterium]|nr:cellulose synthase operon protein YhjQ/BcsQ [Lacipirellulaceae bacterium]